MDHDSPTPLRPVWDTFGDTTLNKEQPDNRKSPVETDPKSSM